MIAGPPDSAGGRPALSRRLSVFSATRPDRAPRPTPRTLTSQAVLGSASNAA